MLDREGRTSLGRLPDLFACLFVADPLALGPVDIRVGGLLSHLGLAFDVDPPSGHPCRQASILTLLADGQGQLVVGHDHRGRPSVLVDQDFLDLGRGKSLHHEVGRILGEGDNVDLLAPQLVDDHPYPGAPGAHTGPHRVDVGVVGDHGNLRPVAGFSGTGLDLDRTVGDLGHLKLEEPLDETWVGTTDHDLGALGRLANLNDVGLEAGIGLRPLEGHLLGLREKRLNPS